MMLMVLTVGNTCHDLHQQAAAVCATSYGQLTEATRRPPCVRYTDEDGDGANDLIVTLSFGADGQWRGNEYRIPGQEEPVWRQDCSPWGRLTMWISDPKALIAHDLTLEMSERLGKGFEAQAEVGRRLEMGVDGRGHPTRTQIEEFDTLGNGSIDMVRLRTVDAEDRLLVRAVLLGNPPSVRLHWTYVYDERGDLVEKRHLRDMGEEVIRSTMTYDYSCWAEERP